MTKTSGSPERVALVTGAASGLGREIAVALGASASAVAVHYHKNRSGAMATADRVRTAGAESLAAGADLTLERGPARLSARVERAFGRIDILVNNVGPFLQKAWDEVTADDWRLLTETNLIVPHALIKAVLPGMRRRRFGRIINIGFGRVGQLAAFPGILPYAAAKTGLLLLTRTAAAGEARTGVTVNMVSPGLLRGGILPAGAESGREPLGTFADVAAAVRFLASEEAAAVSGANLLVAGTWKM